MRWPAAVAAASLVLAGGAGLLLERIHGEAGPPATSASIPLGGFEPVAVDLFYFRATELMAAQRLPEALAAIRVVTELQPRVAEAWTLLGFLLAWRNSATSGDAGEQWRFAREGLRIIERGIEWNPSSPALASVHAELLLLRVVGDEKVRWEAEREMGRPPEAAARDAFRRLGELRASSHASTGFAEAARLLGERLLSRGDRAGAAAAFREALPIFRKIAEDPEAAPARQRVEEIDRRLRDLD
jgi:tetratricopeptide (TPR) repeat protein